MQMSSHSIECTARVVCMQAVNGKNVVPVDNAVSDGFSEDNSQQTAHYGAILAGWCFRMGSEPHASPCAPVILYILTAVR